MNIADEDEPFTVFEVTGDNSIFDRYELGRDGVIELTKLRKGDVCKVIGVRDNRKTMN